MKKYLLTGGFAAMLLLGACGNEEPETSEENTETGETAEAESAEESTEEETTESAEASESTEEETTEEVSAAESDTGEKAEVVKTSEGLSEPLQLENILLDIAGAEIFSGKVTEEIAMFSDSLTEGDDLNGVLIEYNLENTTEAPRGFYISQAQIITNTGEQLDPELFLVEGLQDEMMGAVKSSGKVPYYFKGSTSEEIAWIDIMVPAAVDLETFENLSEPQKVRVEFK